jgi:hypothetical protein
MVRFYPRLADDNGFDGKIPTELGHLKALEILKLDQNQLTGTIPSEIGNLYACVEMNLGKWLKCECSVLPESLRH